VNRRGLSVCAFILLSAQVFADEDSCQTQKLDLPVERAALIQRFAASDADAMRQIANHLECFEPSEAMEASLAGMAFFDASPRRFLEILDELGDGKQELIKCIVFLPPALEGDLRGMVALIERRIRLFDENADLLGDRVLGRAVIFLHERVDYELKKPRNDFPEASNFTDPLLGVEYGAFGRWEPIPLLFLTVGDEARGPHRRMFLSRWADGLQYMVIGGDEFIYEAGNPKPVGVRAGTAWLQTVDDRRARKVIEVLGPASDLFTNPRIPADVRADLCAAVVDSIDHHFLKAADFQAALDARLAKDPDAGFAKPLRDGLKAAGYDVRRYRELPGLGRCGSKKK
jgi:hypothetical protein